MSIHEVKYTIDSIEALTKVLALENHGALSKEVSIAAEKKLIELIEKL